MLDIPQFFFQGQKMAYIIYKALSYFSAAVYKYFPYSASSPA